jgi:hypothetical protein
MFIEQPLRAAVKGRDDAPDNRHVDALDVFDESDRDLLARWPHPAQVAPGQPGTLGEQLAHTMGGPKPNPPPPNAAEQDLIERVVAAALAAVVNEGSKLLAERLPDAIRKVLQEEGGGPTAPSRPGHQRPAILRIDMEVEA